MKQHVNGGWCTGIPPYLVIQSRCASGGVSGVGALDSGGKMSAAVPAWKLALLERKKQQEEAERAKQVKAEEQKLASLPAWKRAIVLREKQTKEGASTPTAAPIINKSTPKWQVAVERVKGSDSPILPQKLSWKSAGAPPLSSKSSASVAPPPPDDPPSTKHEPELSKPTTSKKVASRWQHAPGSTNKATQHSKPAATSSSQSPASSSQAATEDDSSLAGLPAWKKALILKKRKAQQQLVEENTKSKGVDEPDSAANTTTDPPAQANDPVPIQQPEIVNRSNKDGEGSSSSQRLVEQEGITLHPPVYKEIDEWANVNEQDDKFQGLPLWKQALIKRRRADIAKRSGQPVPTPTKDSTKPNTPVNSWSTKESKESTTSTKKANVKANKKSSIESKRKTKQPISSKVRSEVTKPARKAPVAPATKKEPMFTYNFSKSSSSSPHHTLNAGGSSSDSTDSDLEDAVVTNLDDSDEDDSGIVLQSYAVNKTASRPSPIMGQKSLSATTVTEKTTSSSTPRKKVSRKI